MSAVIRAEGLSKRFNIGASRNPHRTMREALSALVRQGIDYGKAVKDEVPTIWALRDVHFEIGKGDVVGIIGRNGAGKSTLMKILSRITEPTSGFVDLRGRVASLLEVGTGFHHELTGRENIFLNGAMLGMTRHEIRNKFDEIVHFSGVERFIDTPVKHYSSGMYMRLAFGVAAHLEPDVLIVDEVLAVGDAAFQKKCLGKMEEAAAEGRTVLLVSHNLTAIQRMCNRALLIEGGLLVRDGATEDVLTTYLETASPGRGGRFDVSRHPTRSRFHTPVLQQIVLLSTAGVPTQSIGSGDELTVEVTIVSQKRIRRPRVGMYIEDYLGRKLTSLASYFQMPDLPDIDG